MITRVSFIVFVLLLIATPGQSQNWQTFYREFTGSVGGEKISGWLTNRFGQLQGGYFYDKYKAEREKLDPRDDRLTIFLEGKQTGSDIQLNETCYLCQDVPDPELFAGELSNNGITGTWHRTSEPMRQLSFQLQFTKDTVESHLPPVKPDDLAEYERKDIWASGFFSNPKVQQELKVTLGKDLDEWKQFVSQPLARHIFRRVGNLVIIELWDDDMYDDRTFIGLEPGRNRIYIAWRGAPDDDPTRNDLMFYGDDRPEEFAMEVLRSLTSSWGHVYDFTYAGKRVIATRKK
jgi:hypothetical protein